jgi:hypothetical protein
MPVAMEKVRSPAPSTRHEAFATRTSPPPFENASVAPEATVIVAGAVVVSVLTVMLEGIVMVTAFVSVAVSLAVCGIPADQLPASVQEPAEPPIHVESSAKTAVDTSKQTAETRVVKREDILFMFYHLSN